MKLREYLSVKYAGRCFALTSAEAKILGIKYPLPHGWVGKFGDMDLSDDAVEKLRSTALVRAEKSAKNANGNKAKLGKQLAYVANINTAMRREPSEGLRIMDAENCESQKLLDCYIAKHGAVAATLLVTFRDGRQIRLSGQQQMLAEIDSPVCEVQP